MTFNFGELAEKMGQPLRVFGNLPYNISTPLMFHLFSYTDAIADMHFMLQKEVVNRLVAGPNSKAYGRLSVMAQYYCNVIPVLEVPPSAFTPPPKVDSAVVRPVPHATMPHPVKDVRVLSRITTEAFNQRRKTIRNSLGNLFSVEVLTEWGSTRRCERKISLSRNIARWRTIWRRTRLFRRVNDDQFAPSVYSGSKRLH